MPVYNESKLVLRRSIDSILNQRFENFEFIIVLDKPDNLEAKDVIEEYISIDPRIVFLNNTKNLGKWQARNNWILKAKWKYIALMDADDFSFTNRFEVQYNFLEWNKNIDVVFPSYRKIFPSWNIKEYICNSYSLEDSFLSWEWHLNWWMMLRTEVLKNNLFQLNSSPEEFELFIRLIKKWYKFYTVDTILYDYIISEKDLNYRYQSNNYGNKKFIILLLKNFKLFIWYKYYFKIVFRTLFFYTITRNKYIFRISLFVKEKLRR